MKPQPTLNCVGRIEKRFIKNSPCHPEHAAPLVADEKEAYKGGCSQSISGSCHRQKCSVICTQKSVSWKEVLDKVGSAFNPTLKYCWGRNPNLQKAISYASRTATRHVKGDLVPAFTLAEVLITLGIIGVVAAMTLPTLIAKYQEKVILTRVKKIYSQISSAINLYKAENEVSDISGLFDTSNTSDQTMQNFAKYFKTIEICSATNTNGCHGDYKIMPRKKIADGNGNTATAVISNKPRFVLSDGALIAVTQYQSCYEVVEEDVIDENGFATGEKTQSIRTTCGFINFDVNGKEKPNRVGQDYFCFGINQDGSISYIDSSWCGNIRSVLATDKLNEVENYNLGSYK